MDVDIYAPPRASAEAPVATPGSPLGVPADLGPWGVLKRALQLYGENLPTLAGIVAVVFLPYEIGKMALVASTFAAQSVMPLTVYNLFAFLPNTLVLASVIFVALEREHTPDGVGVLTAIRHGFGRWGAVLGASFVAGLVIALGMMCVIIPGIYLTIRYVLVTQIAAIEPASNALEQSEWLVKNHWWRVFGTLLVLKIPAVVLIAGVGILLALYKTWYTTLACDLAIYLLSSFSPLGLLVLYLSLRQDPEKLEATGPVRLPWRTEG